MKALVLALAALAATAGLARAEAPAAPVTPTSPSPVASASPTATPTRTVIVGPTGVTLVVTPQVLAGLDREQATLINHSAPHVYEGVLLTELLRLVGADRDYLVVTGGDNFRAVYSLAETDGSVQRHPTILADRMDGAPLTPHDAPYRLVVDGDQKPSRSVYAVTRIEVKVLP